MGDDSSWFGFSDSDNETEDDEEEEQIDEVATLENLVERREKQLKKLKKQNKQLRKKIKRLEQSESSNNNNTQDTNYENEDEIDVSDIDEGDVQKLKKALSDKENEFKQFKKLSKKRQEQARIDAVRDFVSDMSEVRSNLKRALEIDGDSSAENIREGVEATLKQLDKVLRTHGVEEISPEVGEVSDAKRHEVVEREESSEYDSGVIVETIESGFEYDDIVIEPAKVRVADSTD